MKRIFHSYAFDAEKALKTGDFGTSDFTQIIDYNYFMVNLNTKDYCIPRISAISDMVDRQDYYEDFGDYILYLMRNARYDSGSYKLVYSTQRIILKKNKIYPIPEGTLDKTIVVDDFGEEYNICDTCYETYLFIKKEDIEIARKQLELNLKLKKIKK